MLALDEVGGKDRVDRGLAGFEMDGCWEERGGGHDSLIMTVVCGELSVVVKTVGAVCAGKDRGCLKLTCCSMNEDETNVGVDVEDGERWRMQWEKLFVSVFMRLCV